LDFLEFKEWKNLLQYLMIRKDNQNHLFTEEGIIEELNYAFC
jgi:hypothetical protein